MVADLSSSLGHTSKVIIAVILGSIPVDIFVNDISKCVKTGLLRYCLSFT